jgi:hypothetical protein
MNHVNGYQRQTRSVISGYLAMPRRSEPYSGECTPGPDDLERTAQVRKSVAHEQVRPLLVRFLPAAKSCLRLNMCRTEHTLK